MATVTKLTIITTAGLSEANIDASVQKSLELLGVKQVNILYSHMPDPKVSIEESARAFDKQLRAGHCKQLGLCNYNASLMKQWLDVCEKHSYAKPTVWQGQYNAMMRLYEDDLFPLLRQHGIKIFAYRFVCPSFSHGNTYLG